MIRETMQHLQRQQRQQQHQRRFVVIGWLCACLLLSGCAAEREQVGAALGGAWQLPDVGQVPEAPWARVACTPGQPAKDQLACVGGVAITRADFDRVRPSYADHIANRTIIEALVRAEVLAAEAKRRGLWSTWLVSSYKRALVRRLLALEFEEKYQAKDVRAADIDRTWLRGNIRIRYAHEKAWWVTDAQLICCSGDWHKCEIDEAAKACITRLQPTAYELYGKLMTDPPGSPDHMCARVLALKADYPLVTCDHLNYFYDETKPFDKQGDFDLMQESYVVGISKIPVGVIGEPIRTPYGWHIVRLNKIDAKIDGAITDPAVRDEIAHGILTGVRIRDVQRRAIGLLQANNVAIFYDNLDKGLIGTPSK